MKTTVLIPAYNEAKNIARTLDKLPRDLTEPILVLNGSEDDTGDIAASYGATVHRYEKCGKLPAIQSTLRLLGARALEPTLLLDSDTRPIFPKLWHDTFLKQLHAYDQPTYIAGPVIFTPRDGHTHVESTLLTAYRFYEGTQRTNDDLALGNAAYYGPNQAFKLHNRATLDRVTDLPHYWPKEDVAMAKTVVDSSEGKMFELLDMRAAALSQVSVAMPPLHHWITKDIETIDRAITGRYRLNPPENSEPYNG